MRKSDRYERETTVVPSYSADTFQMLAGTRDDIPALMRDPNRLSELLPVVAKHLERVVLDA
jgi:hypothetical protein